MKKTVILNPTDENEFLENFALDVLLGFSSKPKFLPSKYFYDDRGSELFSKIMDSPAYYPTDCEFEIFENHADKLLSVVKDDSFSIIELGAGDGRKTRLLIENLLSSKKKFEYIPVDISEMAIDKLIHHFNELYKENRDLALHGIVGEYHQSLKWIKENKDQRNLLLFLGSNIGNFSKEHAIVFLRTLWKNLNHDDIMIIGFDLKKDVDVLLTAYNDPEGITAEFNLNLLDRMNNLLGANFNRKQFQHFGTYNPMKGAMESYLLSLTDQVVSFDYLEKEFKFDAWEPIHLEYSYKYIEKDIEFLAKEANFEVVNNIYDKEKRYINSVWRVIKDS